MNWILALLARLKGYDTYRDRKGNIRGARDLPEDTNFKMPLDHYMQLKQDEEVEANRTEE